MTERCSQEWMITIIRAVIQVRMQVADCPHGHCIFIDTSLLSLAAFKMEYYFPGESKTFFSETDTPL